jgi:hypothetical protein
VFDWLYFWLMLIYCEGKILFHDWPISGAKVLYWIRFSQIQDRPNRQFLKAQQLKAFHTSPTKPNPTLSALSHILIPMTKTSNMARSFCVVLSLKTDHALYYPYQEKYNRSIKTKYKSCFFSQL